MRSHAPARASIVVAFAILVGESGGCLAPIAGRVAGTATEEAVAALDEPRTRAELADVMASPQIRGAMSELSGAAVRGAIDEVRLQVDNGDLPGLPDDLAAWGEDIDPVVRGITRDVTETALATLLSQEVRNQAAAGAGQSAEAIGRGFARALEDELGPALARNLEDEIGPALARTIARDLGPALADALATPELQDALAQTVANVAASTVRGTDEGIRRVQAEHRAEGDEGLAQVLGAPVALGTALAVGTAVLFGICFVVVLVLLVRSHRRQRELFEDTKRREHAFMDLLRHDTDRLLEETRPRE